MATATAASCGGGGSQVTPTTTTGAPSSVQTSTDGLFTITPQDGSGPVSITSVAPEEGNDAVLGSYDLGPDGAQFDEPMQIDFKVTAEDLADGVLGFVESADGTIEGLTLELVDTDDGRVVRSSLSHFSRITYIHGFDPSGGLASIYLSVPQVAIVGDPLYFGLLGEGEPTNPALAGKALVIDAQRPENWLINPPLEGSAPFPVTCTAVGTPVVSVDGVFDIMWFVYDDIGGSTLVDGSVAFSDEAEITCVEPTPIKEADFRCVEVGTGLETTGCPVPEVSLAGDPRAFLAEFEYPVSDLSVIFSLFMNKDEANPILIEFHSDGTSNGYYGLGFASFPPGGGITGEGVDTEGGSTFTFVPSLSIDPTGTALVFTVASGGGVEGGPKVVTEITVFAEVAGKRSTTLLDMSDVIANWGE